MRHADPHLTVRLAEGEADVRAAQRLRYEVFVEELGGGGPLVDHAAREERDGFDPWCEHLVLVDGRRPLGRHVVGTYRLMPCGAARRGAGFYSAAEFDLGPLLRSGRALLELGRSCLHRDHRGGAGVHLMWQGLARAVERHGAEVLFGVASFRGTDPAPFAGALALLGREHLAPADLRPVARPEGRIELDPPPRRAVDRPAAMRAVPALIKGYLRLGGLVGEGAFVDRAFNTIDVCLLMDTARLSDEARRLRFGAAAAAPAPHPPLVAAAS